MHATVRYYNRVLLRAFLSFFAIIHFKVPQQQQA